MAIDRYELVSRHNPVLKCVDKTSPLTVGNGEFAFTADVTGLQSLYREYKEADFPLCTMSQWGWHTTPVSKERYAYTLDDLVMTEFDYRGRKVHYPKNPKPGNEEVYEWLRKNPHRLNLGRLSWLYRGRELTEDKISGIYQELRLYEGILNSHFEIDGQACDVQTAVDPDSDMLAVRAQSSLIGEKGLTLLLSLPYGSPSQSASDFESGDLHRTDVILEEQGRLVLKHTLDQDSYYISLCYEGKCRIEKQKNELFLTFEQGAVCLTARFTKDAPKEDSGEDMPEAEEVFENAAKWWKHFWEDGGIIRFHRSPDKRAEELERREILSLYLMAVNSSGTTPPQETGLTCNSWYGKMHLEMYLWHCAWSPLWGRGYLLERSLPWYVEHIPEARQNAARNGYEGSRWPKMIAVDGIDSPSKVAPLLVWQQPHIIFMLELAYRENRSREFLEKYWILMKETADFMTDFVAYNEERDVYELVPPVIPVQECHRQDITRNPAFEVVYWRYTLHLAAEWAKRLGRSFDGRWEVVADKMALPAVKDGLYLAHDNCPNTFTEFNRDHPSMLMAMGVLPGEELDKEIMRATLHKVVECWNYPALWGWDFAVMAMTAARLGEPELAVEVLLKDTPKNNYVASGNNRQTIRKDLPLYLPGNGSLLLALPLLAKGFDGSDKAAPGFPENWIVETEGILSYV